MNIDNLSRRDFLRLSGAATGIMLLGRTPESHASISIGYRAPKVIMLGLDGARIEDLVSWASKGYLPNIKKLLEQGVYGKLQTTYPSTSAPAWTSLMMGTNPGKHGVYDFYYRQPDCYNIFLGMPGCVSDSGQGTTEGIRTGTPIWSILSDRGYQVGIIHHPISYPPDPVNGFLISGLGSPGLTPCSYLYTTDKSSSDISITFFPNHDHRIVIEGLPATVEIKRTAFESISFTISSSDKQVTLTSSAFTPQAIHLTEGQWSEWIEMHFPSYEGISRFKLIDIGGLTSHFRLYLESVRINPKYPKKPYIMTSPEALMSDIYDRHGYYINDGWRCDALGVFNKNSNKETFLEQLYRETDEKTAIAADLLSRCGGDLFSCIFEGTDRISHIFWRDRRLGLTRWKNAIRDYYAYVDKKIGQLLYCAPDDAVKMIVSDHGFTHCTHNIFVNAWLKSQELLKLRSSARGLIYDNDMDVDWPNTKAFAYGNGKIRLNVKGREPYGCVEPGDMESLRAAIMAAVAKQYWADGVFTRESIYSGNRVNMPNKPNLEAPDIVFTCKHGVFTYRHADCLGMTLDTVQLPNWTCWSGAHEGPFDPSFIAGTIIMSGPGIRLNQKIPDSRIIDIAPTILHLLGESATDEMDGKALAKGFS